METQTKELILFKESGLIECEGVFTALERQFYNLLLFIAKKQYFYKDKEYWNQNGWDGKDKINNSENYFELRKNKFKTNIKELASFFSGLAGKEINEAKAAEQILNLYEKKLQFNIFKKNKSLEAWLFTHAIPELKIAKSGDIEYSLPLIVFEQLSQQNGVYISFAKLNLLVCLHMKSKFAGILYEILQDYIESPKIPKIALKEIKKLFGLKENYAFFNIRRECLEPAVKEINANPNIPFTVKFEVIRAGQTPVAVKFKIEKPGVINESITRDGISYDSTPKPENQIPGISAERVKELCAKFDLSRLPVEKQKEINERYKYALINFTRNKVNAVHISDSNKKIKEQEQNQELSENNMTDSQGEHCSRY